MQDKQYYNNMDVLYTLTVIKGYFNENTIEEVKRWIPEECNDYQKLIKLLSNLRLIIALDYKVYFQSSCHIPLQGYYALLSYKRGYINLCHPSGKQTPQFVLTDDFSSIIRSFFPQRALPQSTNIVGKFMGFPVKFYFGGNRGDNKYKYDDATCNLITMSIEAADTVVNTNINGTQYKIDLIKGLQINSNNGTTRKIYYGL